MSRLNKRALYQMATRNSNTNSAVVVSRQSQNNGESVVGAVQLQPLTTGTIVPDGRVSGKLTESILRKVTANDGASVSHRARRSNINPNLEVNRSEVLQKLGTGSLGLLTNAYLEQTMMTDNEMHSVQARFYGLDNV